MAAVIVALLAVGLWKPWAAEIGATGVATGGATPSVGPDRALAPQTGADGATQPADPSPATPSPYSLSLDEVAGTLAGVRRDANAAWVVSAMSPEPVSVPFLAAIPATADLGSGCQGGLLIGEGTVAIGLTLPEPPLHSRLTRVTLRRLFDRQPPVIVPVASAHDVRNGVAVVTAIGADWPPGHYALTLDIMERTGMLAVCVGAMIRLVDYSLVAFVPTGTGSRAAREAFTASIGAGIEHP